MLRRTVPHTSSASNSLHSGTGWRVMVRLLPTAQLRPVSTSNMTVLAFVVPTSMSTRYIMTLHHIPKPRGEDESCLSANTFLMPCITVYCSTPLFVKDEVFNKQF